MDPGSEQGCWAVSEHQLQLVAQASGLVAQASAWVVPASGLVAQAYLWV